MRKSLAIHKYKSGSNSNFNFDPKNKPVKISTISNTTGTVARFTDNSDILIL